VSLVMPSLVGKSLTARLPDIHLKDLGKGKGGISPSEAFDEIFTALYKKITSPAVTDVLDKGLKSVGGTLGTISEGTKKGSQAVTDRLKDMFGKP